MFNKLFGKNKESQLNEKLSTGEINWRHKGRIITFEKFPNYRRFIENLEMSENIQFGLHSEVINEMSTTLILRQPIYDSNGKVVFNFQLFLTIVPMINTMSLMGVISDYYNPQSLINPKKDFLINKSISDPIVDLTIEEYRKEYIEILHQALSIQGYNSKSYSTIRSNNLPCDNKRIEASLKEKYA